MKADWDKIRQHYSKDCMSIEQISKLTGVPTGSIKARKNREEKKGISWQRYVDVELVQYAEEAKAIVEAAKNTDQEPKIEEIDPNLVATKEDRRNIEHMHTAKKTGELVNLSKYLPSELVTIMNEIEGMTIVDHLWTQIKMSFAGILRAHKIMWVEDENDELTTITSEGDKATQYKVMYAYERYEAYIKTMTKAYNEHNRTIEAFLKLADKDDPRRVKVIHMDLNVEKLSVETELAKVRLQEAKGNQKDTGLLDTLLESQKEFEQLIESGDFKEFVGEER